MKICQMKELMHHHNLKGDERLLLIQVHLDVKLFMSDFKWQRSRVSKLEKLLGSSTN